MRASVPWMARGLMIIALVGVVELVPRLRVVDPRLLPPLSTVLATLGRLLADGTILRHLWVTVLEVGVAFLVATPLGILVGMLLAEYVYLGRVFNSFIYFLVSVPKSVFLPIFILAMGIGPPQKVAFGVFQAFFVIAINTIGAVRSVPPSLVLMARSCGATRYQIYTRIHLWAMLPVILEGVRLGTIFNITGVILAEMYVSKRGLGYLISGWAESFQLPELLAGIVTAGAISIAVNEALRAYETRLSRWRT